MGYFDNNKSFGKKRSFGKKSFGGGRGDDRQMFEAVCNECGKNCRVPFRPTGGKPVLCSDCFERSNGGQRKFGGRDESRGNPQLEAINDKLDKILELLKR